MNSISLKQLHTVSSPCPIYTSRQKPVLLRCVTNPFSTPLDSHLPTPRQRPSIFHSFHFTDRNPNLRLPCAPLHSSDSLAPDPSHPPQAVKRNSVAIVDILKQANSFLPHVVLGSTLLALIFPPSFTWFTTRYYAPALGFLMFAVGVNSSEKDFVEAFNRPVEIVVGYVGQFVMKPLLGYLFSLISVTVFGLPTPIGAGIALVSCVSGAQLSNYATFLTDPQMAPLSIVMTSLSTASAVFVTPLLSLLLIGKRLPVDVKGMVFSITQIVVAPIALGLLLNRFLPRICNAIRPFLPPLSVFVTALCVGAPLAINIEAVKSPFGASILLLVVGFHLAAFVVGYILSGFVFHDSPDVKALQRTISFETGMQSSLLALALANRFFEDLLVSVPPAISTVIMSLMGFSLVMIWAKRKE
ncbi:probable sodium/metabolite cotransporter BASS5, chloroplastic [Arachis hypogaea]|uniref:probable sodium/metabolite cotransporter BASS5, chloroplastic n=1 Tax=Arachis hypogaea TaxID=3818 RepID=UPI000DEC51A7|nr:probable sodium/metabolite cotransporter BASS5, chloroplastic [Arachis hypogaea]QHO41085.1 putative sodium/metabolite cotransporter BASS5 [Arachis hypogaea]